MLTIFHFFFFFFTFCNKFQRIICIHFYYFFFLSFYILLFWISVIFCNKLVLVSVFFLNYFAAIIYISCKNFLL